MQQTTLIQPVTKQVIFSGIDRALLEEGLVLRVFDSGEGKRVVRIEDPSKINMPDEIRGYGEEEDIEAALLAADQDYLRRLGMECDLNYGTLDTAEDMNLLDQLQSFEVRREVKGEGIRLKATNRYGSLIEISVPSFDIAYRVLVGDLVSIRW